MTAHNNIKKPHHTVTKLASNDAGKNKKMIGSVAHLEHLDLDDPVVRQRLENMAMVVGELEDSKT